MNTDVIYRTIPGISNIGTVMSLRNDRLMSQKLKNGYCNVKLSLNGIQHEKRIHRIMAEAFIENPDNKETVDHIDGQRSNNKLWNLRWATRSENCHNKVMPNNTTGLPGVTARRSKWESSIQVDGHQYHLGTFKTKGEAYEARKAAELQHYGEYSQAISRATCSPPTDIDATPEEDHH